MINLFEFYNPNSVIHIRALRNSLIVKWRIWWVKYICLARECLVYSLWQMNLRSSPVQTDLCWSTRPDCFGPIIDLILSVFDQRPTRSLLAQIWKVTYHCSDPMYQHNSQRFTKLRSNCKTWHCISNNQASALHCLFSHILLETYFSF